MMICKVLSCKYKQLTLLLHEMSLSHHIFRLLIALTYVLAYMGFGIHTCHADGSRHFVWMLGDISCEAIHHHSHDADHDHHHEGGCCSTQVYVLTDAQDSVSDDARIATPEVSVPLLAEAAPAAPVMAAHRSLLAWDSPPPVRSLSRSLISIWLI